MQLVRTGQLLAGPEGAVRRAGRKDGGGRRGLLARRGQCGAEGNNRGDRPWCCVGRAGHTP